MCIGAPKPPKIPPAAERQAMQLPKEMDVNKAGNMRRRRGLWASIFTSPQGIASAPIVTGNSGGVTGG
jgi:hypothetical protein